jgi:hypothetical protein
MILELLFLSLIADFIDCAVILAQLRPELTFLGTLMDPRARRARICALLLVHARLPDYCLSEKVGATFVRLSLHMGKSLVCLRFALYGGLYVPDVVRGLNPLGVAAV